jgi:hypothetical protein
MPPTSNMGEELKFQQRWEFRKGDNEFDSSSEESKSSSSGQPVLKKHRLVSSFISDEHDEAIDNDRFQKKGKRVPGNGGQIKFGKAKKMDARRSRKNNLANNARKSDSQEELNKKKNGTNGYDPAALDDLKIFMESLLKDLKDTRENLLRWMKEEMQKLVADDTAQKSESRKGNYGRKNIQVQHENFKNNRVQNQNNFEENAQVHHQYNFEDNVQVQHLKNFKDSFQVEHQNNSEDTLHVQPQNHFKEAIQVQRENNFKENIQVQHQNNHDTNIVQHRDNLKSGMRAQNCNDGSLKRHFNSNEAAGHHNCYYGPTTGATASTTKEKGELRLVSSVAQNLQSSPSIQVQHQKNFVLGLSAQNCIDGTSERSVKGKRTADSSKCSKALEDRVDHRQVIGSMPSTEKDKRERLATTANPIFSSNSSGQVASSMYLTLPTVLTEAGVENYRLETSPCNYANPRSSRNKRDVNSSNANVTLNPSAYRGYFHDMQQVGRLGSFAQTGSNIVGCLNQNSTPTTSIGTGFPVPLHQGIGEGLSNPSQLGLKNLPQDNYNIPGLRMNGGAITFSGGSYALSEQYVVNNFHRNSNYIADGGFTGFQTPDLKEGRLFP